MSTSKLQSWVNESPERAREYARESLLIDVCEEILAALESGKISKAELAEKLGSSKSHITQLLSGARNMTLRTLADIGCALDRRPSFRLLSKDEQTSWSAHSGFIVRRPQMAAISLNFDDNHGAPTGACNDASWVEVNAA